MIHTRRAFLFPIDVLDAFGKQPPVKPASQTTTSSKPPTVSATPPVLPPAASAGPSKTSDEDFAEVFEREMAAMLRDLVVAQDPSGSAGDKSAPPPVDNSDRDRAIREAWEKMLEKSMDDAFSGVAGDQGATDESEDAFQKNVKEAMERLRRSDTDLQVRFHWDIFLHRRSISLPDRQARRHPQKTNCRPFWGRLETSETTSRFRLSLKV